MSTYLMSMYSQARGLSSALSAASSAVDHIHDWVLGTPKDSWVSMGVISDGSYDQPAGLCYSFPVTCSGGSWSIVQVGNSVAYVGLVSPFKILMYGVWPPSLPQRASCRRNVQKSILKTLDIWRGLDYYHPLVGNHQ